MRAHPNKVSKKVESSKSYSSKSKVESTKDLVLKDDLSLQPTSSSADETFVGSEEKPNRGKQINDVIDDLCKKT